MEFHETLQHLRKQRGLTQEELAAALYVSRAAVSKWESGRGYPNIDSLKAIAAFFSVTVDDLLSGGEALTLAEEDLRQTAARTRARVSGALDCAAALLLFLPCFRERAGEAVRSVSLPALSGGNPLWKAAALAVVAATVVWGILTLALGTCRHPLWTTWAAPVSLLLSGTAVLLFILGLHPYAAVLVLVFSAVKSLMPGKRL